MVMNRKVKEETRKMLEMSSSSSENEDHNLKDLLKNRAQQSENQ